MKTNNTNTMNTNIATSHNLTNPANLLDNLMPSFGQTPTAAAKMPVWNEGQRVFICCQRTGRTGNLYYKGLRISKTMAIVESVGTFKSMTYINGIEVYALKGRDHKLIGKREYPKTRHDATFIRDEAIAIVKDYLVDYQLSTGTMVGNASDRACRLVDGCNMSPMDDAHLPILQDMLPLLVSKKGPLER